MAELKKVQRCYHCGVELQSEDADKTGFIRPEILAAYPEGLLLCDTCFNTQRFNSSPKEANFDDDYVTILKEIRNKKPLVVYVVDLFSFEGSFISKITEMLEGIDVIAIGNKRDLMPKDVDDDKLIDYVGHRLRVSKLQVKDVILTSTNPSYNVDLLIEKMMEYRDGRDIYFVGASFSGKSALISEVLKLYTNNTNNLITMHNFPGTELRGFKIPIDNKTSIYETPGTSLDNSMLGKVEKTVQNLIIPKKAITGKKIRILKGQIMMLGGLAGVQLLENKKCDITLYLSQKINVLITRYKNEKTLDDLLRKETVKPVSERIRSFADFDVYDLEITEEGERDVGILGLGWFKFNGDNQTFRLIVPKGVFVYTTRSKIKYANK